MIKITIPLALLSNSNQHEDQVFPLSMDWQFAFERSEMLREFQSELLASIGHELRNPLSSQMGSLQMILSELCESPEEEREYVGTAKQSVEKLLKLLEEYTRLARHHPPILPLEIKSLLLQPLLKNVYDLTRLQSQDQGIRYDWPYLQVSEASPLLVAADPHGLVQALLGVCRWCIRRLRYGTMSLIVAPTLGDPKPILLEFRLSGRTQFPLNPEESAAWRVCQRLLGEMQGTLTLVENSATGLLIRLTLLTG
jgi:hypothetical protein